MGRLSYGRDWFKAQIAPAIRWAARKAGARPATDDEKLLRGFVVDLEAVDSVADLDLYWRAQPVTTVPREARRG